MINFILIYATKIQHEWGRCCILTLWIIAKIVIFIAVSSSLPTTHRIFSKFKISFRLKGKFASFPLASKFQILVPFASTFWRKTLCNKCTVLYWPYSHPNLEAPTFAKVNIFAFYNSTKIKMKTPKPKNFSTIFQQHQLLPWSL